MQKDIYSDNHDTNDLANAAHVTMQTSYSQEENKYRQTKAGQQKHNTRQTLRQHRKQQTTNKYIMCNRIHTKNKIEHTSHPKLRTSSCAE